MFILFYRGLGVRIMSTVD